MFPIPTRAFSLGFHSFLSFSFLGLEFALRPWRLWFVDFLSFLSFHVAFELIFYSFSFFLSFFLCFPFLLLFFPVELKCFAFRSTSQLEKQEGLRISTLFLPGPFSFLIFSFPPPFFLPFDFVSGVRLGCRARAMFSLLFVI